jgi:hypothetical protein
MSQYDFGTIDPTQKTGTQLAADLNSWRTALHSCHVGPARPSYVLRGMLWINDNAAPVHVVYFFDGTTDIELFRFDSVTHVGTVPGGGGGVTDHGALTGLGDDDHTQYYNQVRGDARYALLTHNHALSSLSDVNVIGLADNDILMWDTATGKWVADAMPSGGALALNDLTDVTISNPIDGQALMWDDAQNRWENRDITGGSGASYLNDLNDVTLNLPATGELLVFTGTVWENQTTAEAGVATEADLAAHINDTSAAHAASAVSFSPVGTVGATTVQAAIQELDTEKATTTALTGHTGAASNAHSASAISCSATGDVVATNVQAAIAELASEKATTTALTAHTGASAGAHAATAISFTPAGTIVANTVQAALQELDSEKSATSHTHAGVYQPADAQLDTLAAITAQQATDLASISTFIGTLMNDADAATARATLGAAASADLTAHLNDATDAHVASAIGFTPTGNIGASTVQAAIAELDTEKGYLDVPANAQTNAYTLALTDRGKSVDTTAGVTVPPNGTVAFPVGSTVTITNTSASAITVTQGSGVTMRQAGTANTGNRTLAAYGVATVRKTATDTWFIIGAGVS